MIPVPAPKGRIAAVLDTGVADAVGGRCDFPSTAPPGASSTLIDKGLTMYGLVK